MAKRPFAVFDIDGTLIRWQLYHAVADKLAKHGALDEADFADVRASRMNWKRRTGELSFDAYEQHLVFSSNVLSGGAEVNQILSSIATFILAYWDGIEIAHIHKPHRQHSEPI